MNFLNFDDISFFWIQALSLMWRLQ